MFDYGEYDCVIIVFSGTLDELAQRRIKSTQLNTTETCTYESLQMIRARLRYCSVAARIAPAHCPTLPADSTRAFYPLHTRDHHIDAQAGRQRRAHKHTIKRKHTAAAAAQQVFIHIENHLRTTRHVPAQHVHMQEWAGLARCAKGRACERSAAYLLFSTSPRRSCR